MLLIRTFYDLPCCIVGVVVQRKKREKRERERERERGDNLGKLSSCFKPESIALSFFSSYLVS